MTATTTPCSTMTATTATTPHSATAMTTTPHAAWPPWHRTWFDYHDTARGMATMTPRTQQPRLRHHMAQWLQWRWLWLVCSGSCRDCRLAWRYLLGLQGLAQKSDIL
jgi:hypothetical protein